LSELKFERALAPSKVPHQLALNCWGSTAARPPTAGATSTSKPVKSVTCASKWPDWALNPLSIVAALRSNSMRGVFKANW